MNTLELETFWRIRTACAEKDVPFEFVYTAIHTIAVEMLKPGVNLYSHDVVISIYQNYAKCILPAIRASGGDRDQELPDEYYKEIAKHDIVAETLAHLSHNRGIRLTDYDAAVKANEAMTHTTEKCEGDSIITWLINVFPDDIRAIQTRI